VQFHGSNPASFILSVTICGVKKYLALYEMIDMHLGIHARGIFRIAIKMLMIGTIKDIIACAAACRDNAVAAPSQPAAAARGLPGGAGDAFVATLA
jgi:hypothetical protein